MRRWDADPGRERFLRKAGQDGGAVSRRPGGTGTSASDKLTSNPALSGSGDPNALVHFTVDGSPIAGTATASGSGAWNFTPTGLADGSHTIIASETDTAGNTGTASLTFTLDTTIATPTLALSDDTGASASDLITNDAALSGSGDPNAVVTLAEGATALGAATADASGVWSFTPTGLIDGAHTIVASETDAAGNTGTASLTFTLDTTVPTIAITAPIAGDNIVNASEAAAGFTISGTAADNDVNGQTATIEIVDGSNTLKDTYTATVASGAWSIDVTPAQAQALAAGNYTVTADVSDAAGNPAVEATQAIAVTKAAAAYTYTTLDVVGSTFTGATAINGAGEVAGYYKESSGGVHGLLYDGGSYTAFDAPGSTSANAYTVALAINNAGEIAGTYDSRTASHGYLDNGGVYITLDPPGSIGTIALAINGTGEVAGWYVNSGFQDYGFLYDGSSYTTLNPAGSTYTQATAINGAGEVAGIFGDPSGYHGFLYDHGSYTTLDAPGSTLTIAEAINDTGVVAGYYQDSAGHGHGFLYDGGSYTTLDVPGFTGTTPLAINGTGEVAGSRSGASLPISFSCRSCGLRC